MCKSSVNHDQGPHLLQSEGLRCLISQGNVPLHHRITHLRKSNLFFAELKNHWCLAGTHCFGRGPKAQVIAVDWNGLHPQVRIYIPAGLFMRQSSYHQPPFECSSCQFRYHCQGANTHRYHDKPGTCTASVEEPRTEVVHKLFCWLPQASKAGLQ